MNKVRDLRSALELLQKEENQLIETDVEVDPMAELSGVYRHVGAGGTVQRPTKEGPAMIFNNVKGHKDARVLIEWSKKQCRADYKMCIVHQQAEENTWQYFNLKNLLQVMKDDKDKQHCWRFQHLAS